MKQLSAEKASGLVWRAGNVPQPLSEAAVSSHRHQQKLSGLLLDETALEPLTQVC